MLNILLVITIIGQLNFFFNFSIEKDRLVVQLNIFFEYKNKTNFSDLEKQFFYIHQINKSNITFLLYNKNDVSVKILKNKQTIK